jgi:hypothetical protein
MANKAVNNQRKSARLNDQKVMRDKAVKPTKSREMILRL